MNFKQLFKTKAGWIKILQPTALILIIYFSVMTIVFMPFQSAAPEIQIDFTNYFMGQDIAPAIVVQVDYKLMQTDDWNMIVRSSQKEISITLPEDAYYRLTIDKVKSIKNHKLLNALVINNYETDDFIVYEFSTKNKSFFNNEIITFKVN